MGVVVVYPGELQGCCKREAGCFYEGVYICVCYMCVCVCVCKAAAKERLGVFMKVCTCVCVFVWVCLLYIHTRMHTYIHKYIHIYSQCEGMEWSKIAAKEEVQIEVRYVFAGPN
jgi:hypothetical protein